MNYVEVLILKAPGQLPSLLVPYKSGSAYKLVLLTCICAIYACVITVMMTIMIIIIIVYLIS